MPFLPLVDTLNVNKIMMLVISIHENFLDKHQYLEFVTIYIIWYLQNLISNVIFPKFNLL